MENTPVPATRLIVPSVCVAILLTPKTSLSAEPPQIAEAAKFIGPSTYWRLHEWVIFHLIDETGRPFDVTVRLADMNTYLQGPSPAMVWIVGPDGKTMLKRIVDDDGVVSGNERYRDGIYDVYQDMLYRAYHRRRSPGRYPPGKSRSPYLEHPEQLPYRTVRVRVPSTAPGEYQLRIVGCYDHWVTVAASRTMPAAVSPGPSFLHVHRDVLDRSYLYIPPNAQDLGISIYEEVEPFTKRLALYDEKGTKAAELTPRTAWNYLIATPESKDVVYRLDTAGASTNYRLAVRGAPFILAPTPAVARQLKGSLVQIPGGPLVHHQYQKTVWEYLHGLKPS